MPRPLSFIARCGIGIAATVALGLVVATPLAVQRRRATWQLEDFADAVLDEANRANVKPLGDPVTFETIGCDARMLIRSVSAYGGRNIILPKRLPDPELCMDYQEVPVVVALDLLALQQGCLLTDEGDVWRFRRLPRWPDRVAMVSAVRGLRRVPALSPRGKSLFVALTLRLDETRPEAGPRFTGERVDRVLRDFDIFREAPREQRRGLAETAH